MEISRAPWKFVFASSLALDAGETPQKGNLSKKRKKGRKSGGRGAQRVSREGTRKSHREASSQMQERAKERPWELRRSRGVGFENSLDKSPLRLLPVIRCGHKDNHSASLPRMVSWPLGPLHIPPERFRHMSSQSVQKNSTSMRLAWDE